MPSGKISNPVKFYARLKVRWLGALWAVFLANVGIIAVLFLVNISSSIKWLGTLIALIVSLMMVFLSKPRINYYDMRHRYELLLATNIGIEETDCQFDQSWVNHFSTKGYMMYLDNDVMQIWYRFGKSLARKTFVKTKMLEIVTIIKHKSIDLYDSRLEKKYKKLWQLHEREQRLNKQIIIQFKQVDQLDKKTKDDFNRIISYREADNYLVTVNCGYLSKTNQVYYLHAEKYAPNAYYKYAIEQIKEIL